MTKSDKTAVRTALPEDEPGLKALWHEVFGDDMADIDYFFKTYFTPALTAVVDGAGTPAAAAYILPAGSFVRPDGPALPCAMLYAIAASPACRGLGYGAAVTRAAGELAIKRGYPAVVLKPADDGLFEFYSRHSEFREYFDTVEYEYPAGELPASRQSAAPVGTAEYRALRGRFLKGAAYIDTDDRGIAYQQHLCVSSGGGLYALSDGDSVTGCAITEPDGPVIRIKELLLDDTGRLTDAVSAIAARFPAERFAVRTAPCHGQEPSSKSRFGMLLKTPELEINPSPHYVKWYGPAFD